MIISWLSLGGFLGAEKTLSFSHLSFSNAKLNFHIRCTGVDPTSKCYAVDMY